MSESETVVVHLPDGSLSVPVRRQRRRTVGLYVSRSGEVEVRAPMRAPMPVVQAFVHSRQDWLMRTRAKQSAQPTVPALCYEANASHLFLGEPWRLTLQAASRWFARAQPGEIVLGVRALTPERISRDLQRFYLQEAEARLPERLQFWHRRLYGETRPLPSLSFRSLRSRWGSCSRDGRILLNISLLRASWPVIDYVIVHELCHLQHFDHGPGFKALLASVIPDWRSRKAALPVHCGF